MTIATFADFKSRMTQLRPIYFRKISNNSGAGLTSSWIILANAGAIPTSAAACTNTTVGALNFEDSVGQNSFDYRIVRTSYNVSASGMMIIVADRLSHTGGLSGTVATTQTTNLPTAALTRYTSGEGVFIALEIYTAIGTTATTATCSYTNQAGTAGQTTKARIIGSTSANASGSFLICPLQDGDTGVRSVESVTLAASTVSAAGAFGVTLFKPLQMSHPTIAGLEGYGTNNYNSIVGGGSQMEPILPNSCLFVLMTGLVSTPAINGVINFMDAT